MNGKQVLNVSFKEDIDRTVNILLVLNVLTICIVLHVVVPTEVEGEAPSSIIVSGQPFTPPMCGSFKVDGSSPP